MIVPVGTVTLTLPALISASVNVYGIIAPSKLTLSTSPIKGLVPSVAVSPFNETTTSVPAALFASTKFKPPAASAMVNAPVAAGAILSITTEVLIPVKVLKFSPKNGLLAVLFPPKSNILVTEIVRVPSNGVALVFL